MRRAGGFFDALIAEFQRAVRGVREDVVERGWFGRPTSRGADFSETFGWRSPGERDDPQEKSFEELWAPRERAADDKSAERDVGLDR